MKKRMERLIATVLAFVMLFSVAGCVDGKKKAKENVKISMYLWDKSMSKELTPWLQEQFPDIDFEFVVGYNTMDYYSDLNNRGALPDIITCRRFSLNDAAHLSGELMDMSKTELVGTFYSSYIENNREMDGAIRWLPMCAEVDGYIANKDLFESCGIPLPTNYAEFVDVCRRFEEQGIVGYMNDYHADYSCMEALQGCAIQELMSLNGTTWRRKYESETEDGQVGLDDKVWPKVFEKFEQYLKDTYVEPEDGDLMFAEMSAMFRDNKVAIMRGTANDCVVANKQYGMNSVMLPYFGETSEDNWLLTYPICQMAVNKKVEQDADKKDAVMKVLDAVFSEDGQRRMATGAAVLSYNKTVNIKMSDSLEQVKDCIDRNHLYIRLASIEMFSVSKAVVDKMITGEYGAKKAYEDFNTRLTTPKQSQTGEVIITQNSAYDYKFGEHGSQAVSSMINTMRKDMGDDIAIGYSNLVSAPVFAGEYTEQQLRWLMAFRVSPYRADYTGAEIRKVMEWLVNVKEDGSNPIRHDNVIPATSGMEYTMKDNGNGTYTLESLTINGQPLDENKVYSVVLFGDDNYIENVIYCNCPMPEELRAKRKILIEGNYNTYNYLIDAVKNCGQLEAPTDYVTIKK